MNVGILGTMKMKAAGAQNIVIARKYFFVVFCLSDMFCTGT